MGGWEWKMEQKWGGSKRAAQMDMRE